MSYDIYLKDRKTGNTVQLSKETFKIGGVYQVDEDFSPIPTAEAELNVTYNYAPYYYEATDGDARFAHDEVSAYFADGTTGPVETKYGLRGLNGKTGFQSIPMLQDMITRIIEKYQKDGEWITTERTEKRYRDVNTNKELSLREILSGNIQQDAYVTEEYTVSVSEGFNEDYWTPTAANANLSLMQLLIFAINRPDGVWSIE